MARAYLSLGSNIEPVRHLVAAIAALRDRFGAITVSPAYRFPAVGFDGPDFVNLAAGIDTDLDAQALNRWLHALEDGLGRRRDQPRYASRTIDVDIVLFDDAVLRGDGNLSVPRDELRHAFVLRPLADIAPHARHPVTGASIGQLWREHPEHATPPVTVDLSDGA
jgi:2-amino-4-hydroxy-6-hydroxymethyldihydropteridine diphosphokinase